MLTLIENIDGGVSVRTPAKINVTLRVTGIRDDGYHLLSTIMRKVPIFDNVKVFPRDDKKIILSCDDSSIPCDERNLAFKAALKYASLFPESFGGASIELTKNIPHGAGMGGGSSDCAAVLLALDRLYGNGENTEFLIRESASLGADVPVFVNFSSDCCLCEGIGEVMTDVTLNRPLINACIVKGSKSASTKEIFTLFDRSFSPTTEENVSDTYVTAFSRGKESEIGSILCNDLQKVTEKLVPSISEAIGDLIKKGAVNAIMTGSGSAVFGVFENMEGAENAEKHFIEKGFFAKAVLI